MISIEDGVQSVEDAFNEWKRQWKEVAAEQKGSEGMTRAADYMADFVSFLVGSWICSHHLSEPKGK